MRRRILKPSHHGPHDAHHAADQPGPEIQEAILFLPRVESGPDSIKEIDVRRITRVMDWGVQRGRWEQIGEFESAT